MTKRKTKKPLRSEMISVTMTPEEKAEFERKAEAEDMPVSSYARKLLLKAP